MKLKTIAACLAGALLTIGMPLPAMAADAFTYTVLDDGTASVTCTDKSLTHADIPAEIDGITVTTLAENCFEGCTALETITFPESLTTLEDYAFHGCAQLDTISIPPGIKNIGEFVFEGCTALTEIAVEDGNISFYSDGGVLYDALKSLLLRYPAARPGDSYNVLDSCTVIAPWAFTDVSVLKDLSMGSVQAIGADAFFCATSLRNVTLSDGITELIGPTFAYCSNLNAVTLPSTLKNIGENCFYGCVSLENVDLPDGLEKIGDMAFYGCVKIKEMTVPASVKSIGEMGVGYSIDPETNENTVIKDFKMKTVSGSKAANYAKRNDIAYTAQGSKTVGILLLIGVSAVLILGGGFWFVYHKRQKEAQAIAAQKEAERREKKLARKKQK